MLSVVVIFKERSAHCVGEDKRGGMGGKKGGTMGFMCKGKLEGLEKELEKYEKRLMRMQKNWAATKSGSAYGEEYLGIQIKVYRRMMEDLKKEILRLKQKR